MAQQNVKPSFGSHETALSADIRVTLREDPVGPHLPLPRIVIAHCKGLRTEK